MIAWIFFDVIRWVDVKYFETGNMFGLIIFDMKKNIDLLVYEVCMSVLRESAQYIG